MEDESIRMDVVNVSVVMVTPSMSYVPHSMRRFRDERDINNCFVGFLAHAKCNIFAFPSNEWRENRTAFFNESQNENDVFSERAFVIISNGVCSGRREMPFGPQTRY